MTKITRQSVRRCLTTGVALFAVVAATSARAQEAATNSQDEAVEEAQSGGIAEIVVTAQKRAQNLQDTPLSVVAVTGDQLEARGVASLSGFDTFIPNVSIGGTSAQGNAIANFAIRGIGGAPSGFVTQESAVGVYVDDILFARPNGALLDLLDVERVEVLRGPQGTLFGRNTAGGAILYVSKKPSDKIEGHLKAVAGSRSRFDVSGVLNIPLSDTFSSRFSFSKKSRDGYITRVIDGEKTGAESSTTMRAQLRWEPTDRLDINLSADLIRTSDNGQPTVIGSYSTTDLYPTQLYGVVVPGDPPINPAFVASMKALAPANVSPSGYTNAASDFAFYSSQVQGRYSVYGGLVPDTNRYKSYGLTGTIAFDLTDNITLKSLTGFRELDQVQNQDWDRTPIPLVALNETINIKYFTQELQLGGSSLGDRLQWVTGVFYYHDKALDYRRRFDPTGGANSALAGDFGLGTVENKFITTESLAAFGQATFEFTDAFSATVGLRWSRDTKDYTSVRDGRGQVCIAGGTEVPAVGTPASCPAGSVSTPAPQSVSSQWSSVSPRFGLQYRWSPEIMTYVSAAKGFKGGGFNDTVQTRCYRSPFPDCGLSEFKAENLWTFEGGIRSDLFDRRVRLNISAFLTKYKDQQIQLIDVGPPPLQYTINADSTVKGLEVEFLAAPVDALMLRANLGYIDSSYDTSLNGLSGRTALTPETPFLRSPKWSYSLGATYTQPVASGNVSVDVNFGWKAKQASTPNPTNMIILPSYGLLNGRLEYKADAGWAIAVYGNNLTDKYYLSGGFDPGGPTSKATPGLTGTPHDRVFGFDLLDVGRPRELGVEVSYRF